MALPRPSHYEILGVSETADAATIRNAFWGRTKIFHDDKRVFNPLITVEENDLCLDILKRLNEAHGVLRDTDKRAKYDKARQSRSALVEDDDFYLKWQPMMQRMTFYADHKDMLDECLEVMINEQTIMRARVKEMEDQLMDAEREIASLSDKNLELERQNKHFKVLVQNVESWKTVQEDESKKQEKEFAELSKKVQLQEEEIKKLKKELSEKKTATPVPSQQPSPATATATSLNPRASAAPQPSPATYAGTAAPQTLFSSSGKIYCPGLVGIQIEIEKFGGNDITRGFKLIFSNKESADDLKRSIEQKLPRRFLLGPPHGLSPMLRVKHWYKDVNYVWMDFNFYPAGEAYEQHLKVGYQFIGYSLLGELDKHLEIQALLQSHVYFWDKENEKLINESALPHSLRQSVFLEALREMYDSKYRR